MNDEGDEVVLPTLSSQATRDQSKKVEEHSASLHKLLNSCFDTEKLGPIKR